MKYEIEKLRFQKLHGYRAIVKTATLIADHKWFSWSVCKKRLKELRSAWRDGMRLLRAAQYDRKKVPDEAMRKFHAFLDKKVDFLKFFDAQITPEVYNARAQPVILDGKRIGVTLKGERRPGNVMRIYYSSTDNHALELVCAKAVQNSTGSAYLDAHGARLCVTEFHVKRLTKPVVLI
jgi:hypothetical protein